MKSFGCVAFTCVLSLLAGLVLAESTIDPALIHTVGLIDEDNGRIASNDPNSFEAQLMEAVGPSEYCGKAAGTLNLIEYKRQIYLIGNSHGFYKGLDPDCTDQTGKFYPDIHYFTNKQSGFEALVPFEFKWPPLNEEYALKVPVLLSDERKPNDLVVLALQNPRYINRQNGDPRKVIKLYSGPADGLKELSRKETVFFASQRNNFHNAMEDSIEYGCRVNDFVKDGVVAKVKKHSCDIGKGSSGASLTFLDEIGQMWSIGINYGGIPQSTKASFEDVTSDGGNFFIPSEEVIKMLERVLQDR